MKKIVLYFLVTMAALGGGMFAQQFSRQPEKQKHDLLMEFSFADVSGKLRSISEWQGKILVINFWATWCPPCRKEIPEFIALQNQLGDSGLQFIGIAIEEKEPVNEYIDFLDINYPVLIAEDAGIALSYRLGNVLNTVPFTVVVDRQGNIIHRHPGMFPQQQILDIVTPLL